MGLFDVFKKKVGSISSSAGLNPHSIVDPLTDAMEAATHEVTKDIEADLSGVAWQIQRGVQDRLAPEMEAAQRVMTDQLSSMGGELEAKMQAHMMGLGTDLHSVVTAATTSMLEASASTAKGILDAMSSQGGMLRDTIARGATEFSKLRDDIFHAFAEQTKALSMQIAGVAGGLVDKWGSFETSFAKTAEQQWLSMEKKEWSMFDKMEHTIEQKSGLHIREGMLAAAKWTEQKLGNMLAWAESLLGSFAAFLPLLLIGGAIIGLMVLLK